jgi:inhibitor of cysteine peptidase
MNAKYYRIPMIFLLISTLMLVSCSSSAKEIKIGKEASGTQVELRPGQVLVISLESNPSTGYGWHIAEIDEAIIKQVGETEFNQQPSDKQLVGAGGEEVLRFEAVGSGTTTLSLTYDRIWESVPPEDSFTVTIVVP